VPTAGQATVTATITQPTGFGVQGAMRDDPCPETLRQRRYPMLSCGFFVASSVATQLGIALVAVVTNETWLRRWLTALCCIRCNRRSRWSVWHSRAGSAARCENAYRQLTHAARSGAVRRVHQVCRVAADLHGAVHGLRRAVALAGARGRHHGCLLQCAPSSCSNWLAPMRSVPSQQHCVGTGIADGHTGQ